jgi:beta-galactosidase
VFGWREWLETALPVQARYADGEAAVVGGERIWYVGCQGDAAFTASLMRTAARRAGLVTRILPTGVRLRRRGSLQFAFNYGASIQNLPVGPAASFLVGSAKIKPHDLAIWRSE